MPGRAKTAWRNPTEPSENSTGSRPAGGSTGHGPGSARAAGTGKARTAAIATVAASRRLNRDTGRPRATGHTTVRRARLGADPPGASSVAPVEILALLLVEPDLLGLPDDRRLELGSIEGRVIAGLLLLAARFGLALEQRMVVERVCYLVRRQRALAIEMSIPALQRKMLFDDRSKQRFGFRHH